MRLTLLDRYLSKRLLFTLAKVVVALLLIVIVVDLLATRRRQIEKYDVPWRMILEYYATFAPTVLFKYQAAAVGMLLSGLIVFGRAAQDNEITAALAGGVSLRRLVRTPLLLAMLLTVGTFFAVDTLGAAAYRRFERLDNEYFRGFSPGARQGVSWTNLSGDWTAHIRQFNRRALTGEGVIIHSVTPELVQDIQARRIYWDETRGKWIIEDGRWFAFDRAAQLERTTRITQIPAPFAEPPDRLFALDESPDGKSAAALRRDLRLAGGLGMPVQAQWVDYHAKFAQPALLFIMLLLAVPFALRVRRGGVAISFGLSIAIGLAYILLFFIATGLGHLQQLPPPVAAWLPSALFLGLGAYLFRKTPT
ncbi:MAG TPA: LptF/LptG family permease [Candidatus Hydrogenedentes bacterium]|nr:LptF/LptG family permease [Candidatus Hydrogenedentota bacterium]HNT86421.1 LptF/LptG family permease [Candidatus Hydrogenedentota bacterium]